MTVEIDTYLLQADGEFQRIAEVESFTGDEMYIEGAIVLRIDGKEILGLDLWDDVNWLWPFIIQASDQCYRTGAGEIYFPDQPLKFRVERLVSSGRLSVSVKGGDISREAVATAREYYSALKKTGLEYFDNLKRLTHEWGVSEEREIARMRSWCGAVGE